MEFVMVFALAAVVAIVFNWGQPKLFASTNAQVQSLQKNYFGKTLLTTVVIFGAIVFAGWVFKLAGERVVTAV